MSAKSSTLARLGKLYGMIERLDALQVRAAASALDQAECGVSRIELAVGRQAAAARAGLAKGSLIESASIDRTSDSVSTQRALLAALTQERQRALDSAADVHRAGQVELRKISRLLEQEKSLVDARTDRLAQHQSDDRFLSQAAWLLGQEDLPPSR